MRQAVKISECAFDQPFKRVEVPRPLCHYLFIFKFPTTHAHARVHTYVPSQAFTVNYLSHVLGQASALP